MGSRYEVEVTIVSAKDLKNVNWRHGHLKPYAAVWVDPNNKSSTRVDEEGDMHPYWNQILIIPFNTPIAHSYLYMDILHAKAAEGTKPIVGSARLPLRNLNLGKQAVMKKLELVRLSSRPHGKVVVNVVVRETRYHSPEYPYYAQPYGVVPPPPQSFTHYSAAPPAYGSAAAYNAPPATPYQAYRPSPPGYGRYGQGATHYGQAGQQQQVYLEVVLSDDGGYGGAYNSPPPASPYQAYQAGPAAVCPSYGPPGYGQDGQRQQGADDDSYDDDGYADGY